MGRRHIAIFTPPIGGHVYPALGVCSELVSRGHRVTYPINEGLAARVRDAGAQAVEFTVPEFRSTQNPIHGLTPEGSEDWGSFSSTVTPWVLATAAATVTQVRGFYATNPPDLILYDWFAFAGRILAKQLERPAAQVHGHFAHTDSLMRIDGVRTTPEPMLAFAESVDSFMSRYGFEGRRHLWHFEKLNIFFVPRAFQYDSDWFDDRFKFVGATHNRQPRVGVWKQRTAHGGPLLLISEPTSSTDGSFLSVCVHAFADSQYHVVFSKAASTPEVAWSLPRNFEINRDVFNCEILPFANLMLCQGGMGTTLESLYHGVPVVAVPPNPFNSEVSYRMAELGLGVHIRRSSMTAGTLRRAIDAALSDESLLRRVKRMQCELASSPGAPAAADAIEAYLG
jgi:MGT family glycosyltransferase